MKLLIDMNLSPRWIGLLNHAGWEAVHWSTVGSAIAADSEIMAFAAENDYVVLTHDLDFGQFLQPPTAEDPVSSSYGLRMSGLRRSEHTLLPLFST